MGLIANNDENSEPVDINAITLAVDDKLLEKVRALATQRGTTVNAMVRDHFEKMTGDQERLAP